MRRPLHIWLVFALCLVVVLAAIGWISLTAVKLDRDAKREESVRLALWRMESALAPFLTQESARPYFSYNSFYAAERAYTRIFSEINRGEVLVPSPLLTQPSTYILLHFQFGPDGELTSPQAPTGNMRDNAEAAYSTHEQIEASAARLAELRKVLGWDKLRGALPEPAGQPTMMGHLLPQLQRGEPRARRNDQSLRNDIEWQARFSSQNTMQANLDRSSLLRSADVQEGMMKPVWMGTALVLARRVSVGGRDYVQGCWLDWPVIEKWLVESVNDLLPRADLEPSPAEGTYEAGRMLAGLPVRLVPGEVTGNPTSRLTPMQLSLVIAWSCLILAAAAVAALLRGALSLSERRGAFVSAVTHELRTPLTTLRMYTEMLAEDMVSSAEKARGYVLTLRQEAERLGRLVENVLAYAGLEARRARGRVETATVGELIERVKDRLLQRAEQSGMKLVVGCEAEMLSVRARADRSAVEQILFNLVDNACKYAASAANREIHLEAGRRGRSVFLRVRDHGPGIAKRDARRLFRPFSKSAWEAAHSASGVGLGLALSRRLARRLGGDLRLDENASEGASFVLTLPASAESKP